MSPPPGSYRGFLHVDAAIDAFNAGGPLIDMAGQVIGVNAGIRLSGSRLGLAVPIDRVRDILPMLVRDGRVSRTWLGAFVAPVSEVDAARAKLAEPAGARVVRVVPRGPASKAGIRVGDILPWIASVRQPYSRIEAVVWRDGAATTIEIIAEPRPE
jgi:serine protease Do